MATPAEDSGWQTGMHPECRVQAAAGGAGASEGLLPELAHNGFPGIRSSWVSIHRGKYHRRRWPMVATAPSRLPREDKLLQRSISAVMTDSVRFVFLVRS